MRGLAITRFYKITMDVGTRILVGSVLLISTTMGSLVIQGTTVRPGFRKKQDFRPPVAGKFKSLGKKLKRVESHQHMEQLYGSEFSKHTL